MIAIITSLNENYMNKTLSIPVLILGLLALSVFAYFTVMPRLAIGSAPSGLQATIATSSNPTVGTTALLVFATSTCSTRIVSTYASPVMMYFSDITGQRPSPTAGHLQAASTTVAYDSGLYGCGAVYMYGFVSTAITVSEAR